MRGVRRGECQREKEPDKKGLWVPGQYLDNAHNRAEVISRFVLTLSLSAEGHCTGCGKNECCSDQVGEESGLLTSTVSSGDTWRD